MLSVFSLKLAQGLGHGGVRHSSEPGEDRPSGAK